jgi:site-specific DNA-methyltransferase (adenine-specific)
VKHKIRQAFVEARDGYSPDRVVADPELNQRFLNVCRALGLTQPASELNGLLLNARKAGWLAGLSTSKPTAFRDQDEYRYASEVAARYLQQRTGMTLDRILCDPELAIQFDVVAAEIAPGHKPLQYRWAALNLRKSRSLQPELLSQVVAASSVNFGPIDGVDLTKLPVAQGIYIFYGPAATLYIGETANLRKRLQKHLDHSDNKELAHWFWTHGHTRVFLEVRILPDDTTQRVRSAMERELIQSRQPLFNIRHLPPDES